MIWNQFIKKYLKTLQNKQLFVLLFILVLFSCMKRSDTKELIFLITLDTTRADSIDYQINNRSTPNLAYLAGRGVIYEKAYSLIPITLPSHYSMFYSLPPWRTRVFNNGDKKKMKYPGLSEILKNKGYFTGAVISLGVLKSDFGINKGFMSFMEDFSPGLWYRTAEEVNTDLLGLIDKVKRKKAFYWVHYSDPHSPYFSPEYKGKFKLKLNGDDIYETESTKSLTVSLKLKLIPGKNTLKYETEIPQNFPDEMKKKISGLNFKGFEVSSLSGKKSFTLELPKSWIKRNVKGRKDYTTSELGSNINIINNEPETQSIKIKFIYDMSLKNSYKKKAYLKEVSYMDSKIGDLIEFLKKKQLFKYSTFVIMGDHGEGLGEYRGHIGHIHYHNKVYSKVPMIVSGNKIDQNGTASKLTSNLNIAPTILDIANIKKPEYMMGSSLLKDEVNKGLFLETYRPQAYYNSFSLIEYPYQIIYFPEKTTSDKYEFIDLKNDQYGIKNILEGNEIIKHRMIKKVRKMAKFCLKNKKNKKDSTKRSAKDDEMLRSLGYL